MKPKITLLMLSLLLLCAFLLGGCSKPPEVLPPNNEMIIDDTMTDFKYEFVEPLKSPLSGNMPLMPLSRDEVFSLLSYMVRGTVTSLREMKTSYMLSGQENVDYLTIAEMDVVQNYGSRELEYEHGTTVTFLYMACSYHQYADYVKLELGKEYILFLNETTKNSQRVGLEEYARYSPFYAKYTVIEKMENGYNAKAFMTVVMELEEKEVYTLSEIEDAVEPYLDKMLGLSLIHDNWRS